MTDDLERRLADALSARAQSAVPPERSPAPLDLTDRRTSPGRARWLAPLATAAAVLAVAAGIGVAATHHRALNHAAVAASTAALRPAGTTVPVKVRLALADPVAGGPVGVGMPVVAYFSRPITDARAFAAATLATVNGEPASGAWYFETTAKGYPMQAHFRLQDYWPSHAKVAVSLPVSGLSAGTGLSFAASTSVTFTTGAADIATINDATHQLTLVRDGKPAGVFAVSLGASDTPTSRGTKVIMTKGASICLSGPGYHECGVKYTQQLTADGEYLIAAPWNAANIGKRDSSNGCTNLSPSDAAQLFSMMQIGDVLRYPDATGPVMSMTAGLGDWNVPWTQWLTGGVLATH